MLQYLQNHSLPDITFAVSQCARFVHNPRRCHERALEHIGQYLKGTVDRGLLLQPNNDLTIYCYVDADFAGLWPHEEQTDPVCVKSRTGFVICISNCPVIWGSKLQHEISKSTMEAEYNALSYTMRELLPSKLSSLQLPNVSVFRMMMSPQYALLFGKIMRVLYHWRILNLVNLHPVPSFMQLRCIGFVRN
jgi:hypothetical protein